MATWKQHEIEIILNYLKEQSNAITNNDHQVLQLQLPNRSLPAIKKKCLELKNNPTKISKVNKWTKEELESLVREYSSRNESQINSRIKQIKHLFPERTEKSIATKLREAFPDIYYRKAIVQPKQNETPQHTVQPGVAHEVTPSETQTNNNGALATQPTIQLDEEETTQVESLIENNLTDFPMAASFPHFLYGDPELRNYVTGLKPEEKKHQSFVYIEPVTGIPLNSRARSQSNLILKKLTGFRIDIEKFSDIVLPMFWAEYNQVGLPWYIAGLMYFTVKVLPILQRIFTIFLLASGIFLVVVGIKQKIRSKKKFLMENKLMHYEHKSFIKV